LKLRTMVWRDLVEQVKYWDAIDLIDNFEEEMRHADSGLLHCIFCQGIENPYKVEISRGMVSLSPEIHTMENGIRLDFHDLHGLSKEDIEVSVDSDILSVTAEISDEAGNRFKGTFSMRIPYGLDPDSCDAEFDDGLLSIILSKSTSPKKRTISVR